MAPPNQPAENFQAQAPEQIKEGAGAIANLPEGERVARALINASHEMAQRVPDGNRTEAGREFARASGAASQELNNIKMQRDEVTTTLTARLKDVLGSNDVTGRTWTSPEAGMITTAGEKVEQGAPLSFAANVMRGLEPDAVDKAYRGKSAGLFTKAVADIGRKPIG